MFWTQYGQCEETKLAQEKSANKARLNAHGGKQQYRVSYCETYATVVT